MRRNLFEAVADSFKRTLMEHYGVPEGALPVSYSLILFERAAIYGQVTTPLCKSGSNAKELTNAVVKTLFDYLWAARKGKNAEGEPPLIASDFLEKANSFVEVAAFSSTRLQAFYRTAAMKFQWGRLLGKASR